MDAVDLKQINVKQVNLVLCWLLPAALLAAGLDLARCQSEAAVPARPLPPSLEEITQPLPPVEPPGLSGSAFEQPQAPVAAAPVEPSGPVVAPEGQWKLRGVLMLSGNRRACLEDESGKSVWITEGERVGSARVKEIKENSVVLERKDGDYEIRM